MEQNGHHTSSVGIISKPRLEMASVPSVPMVVPVVSPCATDEFRRVRMLLSTRNNNSTPTTHVSVCQPRWVRRTREPLDRRGGAGEGVSPRLAHRLSFLCVSAAARRPHRRSEQQHRRRPARRVQAMRAARVAAACSPSPRTRLPRSSIASSRAPWH